MTAEEAKKAVHIPSNSEESFKDHQSVSFVMNTLSTHRRVSSKIETSGTTPNIDGYLYVQNKEGVLFGTLETQVKTLPNGHNLKYDCPVGFFSYCENAAGLPVIFIAVDNDNKVAYWLHFSKSFLKDSNYGENTTTKRVSFNEQQIIDEQNKAYVDSWMDICREHNDRIKNSELLFKEKEKLRMQLLESENQSNPAINRNSPDFVLIHKFLDRLNNELDNNFPIVKIRMFSNLWKLGLAYHQFNETTLSYSLYPIQINKNDVQIKEITENLHQEILNKRYGLTAHYAGNPIKVNPECYALSIVQKKVFELLELKALSHKENNFLLKEFLMAFADKFHISLGLEEKDKYHLTELKSAFRTYLPIWIDEALKDEKILTGRMNYIDPDLLLSQMDEVKRKAIDSKVRKRISEGDLKTVTFTLGSRKFLMRVFVESLNYLEEMKMGEIDRIYVKKEFNRIEDKKSSWIWNVYSKDTLEKNLKIIFENLLNVYEDIIENNFTKLKEELNFFKGFNRLLIVFEAKEKYEEIHDSPSIAYYYIVDEELDIPKIEIFQKENIDIKENFNGGMAIEYEGREYKVIKMSHGVLDFIFDDLPMLDFVYKLIEERLKEYFEIQ